MDETTPPSPPPPADPELLGEMQRHLRTLEDSLAKEQERAIAAESALKAQHGVAEMFSTLSAQIRDLAAQPTPPHEPIAEPIALLARAQAALAAQQEEIKHKLLGLADGLDRLAQSFGSWRSEAQSLGPLPEELRALSKRLSEDSVQTQRLIVERLEADAAERREQLAAWQRRQELESERQDARLEALGRERAAMARDLEDHGSEIYQRLLKERIKREDALDAKLGELAASVDALEEAQNRAARAVEGSAARADEVYQALGARPRSETEEALRRENEDLLKSLRERSEALHRHAAERREIERTLGESLLDAQKRLEEERAVSRAASARSPELELAVEKLKDQLASAERRAADQQERYAALDREREGLARSLIEETERRLKSEEDARRKLAEAHERLAAEGSARAENASVMAQLKSQLSTLADQLAKALQEKEAVLARFSHWDAERAKLASALREKDQMLSMLGTTFQSVLKKP